MTAPDWLAYLDLFADEPLWIDGRGPWTRGEVATAIRERARSQAVGQRVPLTPEPTREGLIELLAVLAGGGTAVLLPRREPASRRRELAAAVRSEEGPPGQVWVRTSGTMGRARWLVHTPWTLITAAEAAATRVGFGRGGVWRMSLPMDHVGGLSLLWRALVGGGAVATDDAPVAVTHCSLVPTQLHRAVVEGTTDRWRDLRCLLIGGAPLPAPLRQRALEAGLPLTVSYGLTETGAFVAASLPGDPLLAEPDYAGRPLWPSRTAVAADGEILLAVPSLGVGRADDQGRLSPLELDGEGWLRTGDLGRLDRDALHVSGRRDNLIVSGGEKLAAEELEAALLELPGVRAAVVVPLRDPEYGQRPVAFLDPDAAARWTSGSLADALAGRIARWKLPIRVEPLPVDGFKPDRAALRTLAEGSAPDRWSGD
ncbi:AMP-binding protein [bacterium]|nr:AMP-binding protein [bacterium]